MPKFVISLIAILMLGTAAQAASGDTAQRGAKMPQAHHYWLSEGLNRLVFWPVPATARGDQQSRRS